MGVVAWSRRSTSLGGMVEVDEKADKSDWILGSLERKEVAKYVVVWGKSTQKWSKNIQWQDEWGREHTHEMLCADINHWMWR